MAHVLVLGGGWVGSAVARAASARGGASVVDPLFDPALAPSDERAGAALRDLVATTAATTVVNACGRIVGDDQELAEANVEFPRWLCASLTGTSVRLVHVGSASEYGDPGGPTPVSESIPTRASGTYARTKAAGSEVVLAARGRGLDAVVARVFNLVGRPIPAVSPIHQWTTDLEAIGPDGGSIDVWWPPTTRDFIDLDDAARALIDLALYDRDPLPSVLNICSGTGLSFGDIVEALARRMDRPVDIRSLERPGIEAIVGDPALLERTIGWCPTMTVDALAALVLDGTRGDASAPR